MTDKIYKSPVITEIKGVASRRVCGAWSDVSGLDDNEDIIIIPGGGMDD